MAEMHKGIDFPKSVVGHLFPESKGQVSKQSTTVVGEITLIQTNPLRSFPSSGRLVETLSGNVSILTGLCFFKTANLFPHSKNLKGILQ